ncbi:hypothetical protein TNIN_366731 [Trichonephila inaurata madagascariensis]|uniref:Uncharacterized protein n=1 Tax=Trichonephila inaurata madagascariensis TaxID=2747483 RepID=A0A8X6IC23_9ARAC|nr:hypothetical protein TNIN_366731 [Trichonephila inaurata madagascariensis]
MLPPKSTGLSWPLAPWRSIICIYELFVFFYFIAGESEVIIEELKERSGGKFLRTPRPSSMKKKSKLDCDYDKTYT